MITLLLAAALSAEPAPQGINLPLIERIERRIDEHRASLDSSVAQSREWGKRWDAVAKRFDGSFLDRLGTLLRGLYYVALAALVAVIAACVAFVLRELAGAIKAFGDAVKAWRAGK